MKSHLCAEIHMSPPHFIYVIRCQWEGVRASGQLKPAISSPDQCLSISSFARAEDPLPRNNLRPMSAKSASPRHSPTFRGVACASFFEVPDFWSSWKLSTTGQHFLHEIPRLWLVSRTHGLGGIRYQAATWR